MWLGIELVLVMLLMAVGMGVVDVSPQPSRRILTSFLGGTIGIGVCIVILSIPSLTAPLVRVAIALLGAYILRWIVTSVVDFIRGPFLMEPPRSSDISVVAHRISRLSQGTARRVTRRVLRNQDTYIALAALSRLPLDPEWTAESFEERWRARCEETLERVSSLVRRFGGATGENRMSVAALQFLAQAMCLFEEDSVEKILSRQPRMRLAERESRMRLGTALEKSAERNCMSESLGLVPPTEGGAKLPTALSLGAVIWPVIGLRRAGFSERAAAFGIAHGVLLVYGIAALMLDRVGSGFVFLAVAALIHIVAALALSDFVLPHSHARTNMAGGKTS